MTASNERQVGGQHYRSGYQHWDLVWRLRLGYFPGQITKYALRWRKKNGAQDLAKAMHFAEKYIELIGAGEDAVVPAGASVGRVEQELRHFKSENTMDEATATVFALLAHTHSVASLQRVLVLLGEQAAALAAEPTPAYVNQDAQPQ